MKDGDEWMTRDTHSIFPTRKKADFYCNYFVNQWVLHFTLHEAAVISRKTSIVYVSNTRGFLQPTGK